MSVNRGRFIVVALGVIFGLGVYGAYTLDPQGFLANPADYLYKVVQLFAAEGDWTAGEEALPWSLEIARFLAPVFTVASLVLLFAEGIWTGLINLRVRIYHDHVIIVGLSDAAMVLIRSCRRRRLRVVVIEHDMSNPHLAACRTLFVPVLIGDGKQGELLRRARVHRARCLISFVNVDDDNVELSLRIQEVVETARAAAKPPLKVVLQVADMQLGSRLESYPKFFEHPQRMEVRFFNLDEQAARALFRDYLPDVYADALACDRVHIVVLGYQQLGKHIVSTALKQAHYGNDKALKITVLDPDAESAAVLFHQQCPDIGLAAEVEFLRAELVPEFLRRDLERFALHDATMMVTCLESDADNMSMALALRQLTLLAALPNAPVFVALRNSRGLAQLVESGRGNPEIPDGLYPFGTVEQLMRVDRVINENLDQLAIALHDQFLEEVAQQEEAQPSHRPWGQLSEVFRNDSRALADHIPAKLRAGGYRLVRKGIRFSFSQPEIERLARIEKNRWNAEKASLGWRFAEQRSDLAKVHPGLKAWRETSAEERAYDLASVRELPRLLGDRLGLGVSRQIVIGITGHRAHRLIKHKAYVERQVHEQLKNIASQYPGADFAVLSALADGSDRLVADLALETLNARLIVALPLPYEIYKRSFGHRHHMSNEDSNEEFQRFVGRASLYFEMPLRFGGAQLLERDDAEGEAARAMQYALAGAYIVSRSQELIAVWDGKDARGVGGTAEVVSWRSAGAVPDEYAFPPHFYPAVEMTPPRVISIPGGDDSKTIADSPPREESAG